MNEKEEVLKQIPVVLLGSVVPFENIIIQLELKDEKSKIALNRTIIDKKDVLLGVALTPNSEIRSKEDLFEFGILAKVKQWSVKDGKFVAIFETFGRALVKKVYDKDDITLADVLPDKEEEIDENSRVLRDRMLRFTTHDYFKKIVNFLPGIDFQDDKEEEFEKFMSKVCMRLPLNYQDKLELLGCESIMQRYTVLMKHMTMLNNQLQIKVDVDELVNVKLSKNQRDYFLREKIKVIHEELGDVDPFSEYDNYKKLLEESEMNEEAKKKVADDINKLKNLNSSSQELSIQKAYLDTVFDYPWNKKTQDKISIDFAKNILDKDHYGFDKVKERILEHVAIREFNPDCKAPILCLVGPPGTGKTSIAVSIAKALNKKFVRLSLGGVTDESEIRGHRRTYLGAMPGRIVKGIVQVGVNNPLILFDEIDKLGSDYKGDPSSALLEVLDSEQNISFRDNYLELPVDLSNVFFITTANSMASIPRPLLDRMDVIEVNSYTDNEKFHIAKDYLYKKQLKAYGIKKSQVNISDEALKLMIKYYVREAGVRQLERTIGKVIRKGAKFLIEKDRKSLKITQKNLEIFLSKPIYRDESLSKKSEIGIVRGLAYTSVGGCTLQIEVNTMPGKGKLELTGQLGDVMKESAVIAQSYVRSIKGRYAVEPDFFETNDIHVHIPEGAVPKDGPSAGITLASALVSAIKGIPAKANLCMTGEVTLRGKVLAIGGLKEKILAAKNSQITNVLVPVDNERDIQEIDSEITDGLKIVYVDNMNQVLNEVFSK